MRRMKRTVFSLMTALVTAIPCPLLAGDYFNGQEIYEKHCASCHGSDGRGLSADTPDFTRGDSLFSSDLELFDVIANDSDTMHGFKHILSNEEILDVISYLRGLER